MAPIKLTLREFRRRPGRATLTLLSIAIGIAAVVAVYLASGTTRRATQRMYDAVTGLRRAGGGCRGRGRVPAGLVEKLQQVPGVQAAVPCVQRFTKLYSRHKQFQMLLLGIDPAKDSAARDYEVTEGVFAGVEQPDARRSLHGPPASPWATRSSCCRAWPGCRS